MIWFILFIAGCYALTVRWIVGEISAAGRDGQSVERSGSSGASPRRFLISPFAGLQGRSLTDEERKCADDFFAQQFSESSQRVASVEFKGGIQMPLPQRPVQIRDSDPNPFTPENFRYERVQAIIRGPSAGR